jgi:hypothetical protein
MGVVMSEYFAKITFSGGEQVEATRENTTVYNHYGMGELYDHVFVSRDGEHGGYVWRQIPPENPAFVTLAALAVENECEVHINIKKVPESDLKAFGQAALRGIDETPEWLPPVS